MKLGIYVSSFRMGGGGYQYKITLLESLERHYPDSVVIFINESDNSQPFERFLNTGWKLEKIPQKILRDSRKATANYFASNGIDVVCPGVQREARDFFLKHKIDLLIFSLPADFPFMWGIPYIMPVHDLQHQLQPEFPEVSAGGEWHRREYMFRNAIRYAQGILVDSDVGKEDVLTFYDEYIPSERVYPLPFVPAYRPEQGMTEARKIAVRNQYQLPERYLFYPAQFWLHKNHSRLVHAIHQLRAVHGIDAPLILVGNDKVQAGGLIFQNAMFLAEQLGVKDLVRHLGYVPDEDMPLLYSMATALTMPTFFGPTNIPVLEAWAFGCPVLSSDIRGIREQVGDAGIVVDPKDTSAMTDAIFKLWKDESLRQTLIGKGYQRLNSYTQDDFAERISAIIDEVSVRVSNLKKTSDVATLLTNTKSLNSAEFLATVADYIGEYLINPLNRYALDMLKQIRLLIAKEWLKLPSEELKNAYGVNLGREQIMLISSGLKSEPLTEEEIEFCEELQSFGNGEVREGKNLKYLLATMLYKYPHQLSSLPNLTTIPEWLLDDYLKFVFESPNLFWERGELNSYSQYLQQSIDSLHQNISSNPSSLLWQKAASSFTQNADLGALRLTTAELKDIYAKRAEIIELNLKNQGAELDYDFAYRLPDGNKIRLGILIKNLTPNPETLTAIPVYKFLNRDLFDIFLYVEENSNHRLERYCFGHGDKARVIPQDLASQVKTIRDDDLDVLFIASNVAATANTITKLALHRLARVQAIAMNSPVTTGMRHVDYYISGKLTEPENEAEQHYTETLITLDGAGLCVDFGTEEQVLATISISRESIDIPEDAVVYVSGANFDVITPEIESAWIEVIESVPNSRLILYSGEFESSLLKRRLRAKLAGHNLDEDRAIALEKLQNRADVKEVLKLADVYLDTYPSSSVLSLVESLEMGLPTVVMEGKLARSRIGSSLLGELEMPDLIAESEAAYIKVAVSLGTNAELRKQTSDRLKQKFGDKPSFLDSRSYSTQMGALFQKLFQNHLADALGESLRLREINLIIFPDWSQSEEELYNDFARVLTAIASHTEKGQITLLVDTSNISEEDADMALSSMVMNLMMEEELDVEEGPDISLVGELNQLQWEALLSRVWGKIGLECENGDAIAPINLEELTTYEVHNLPITKSNNKK